LIFYWRPHPRLGLGGKQVPFFPSAPFLHTPVAALGTCGVATLYPSTVATLYPSTVATPLLWRNTTALGPKVLVWKKGQGVSRLRMGLMEMGGKGDVPTTMGQAQLEPPKVLFIVWWGDCCGGVKSGGWWWGGGKGGERAANLPCHVSGLAHVHPAVSHCEPTLLPAARNTPAAVRIPTGPVCDMTATGGGVAASGGAGAPQAAAGQADGGQLHEGLRRGAVQGEPVGLEVVQSPLFVPSHLLR